MLASIASVLAVDDPGPLRERLIAAAGPSLVPDTPGWIAYRVRRGHRAILAGHRPLSADLARRIDLHQRAGAAWRESLAILNRPDTFDDLAALDRAEQLRAQA